MLFRSLAAHARQSEKRQRRADAGQTGGEPHLSQEESDQKIGKADQADVTRSVQAEESRLAELLFRDLKIQAFEGCGRFGPFAMGEDSLGLPAL